MIFTLLLFRVCAEEGIYMGTAASLRCVALSGHNTLPLAVDPVLHTTRILGVHKMERKKNLT
jgi:hypothetical protein